MLACWLRSQPKNQSLYWNDTRLNLLVPIFVEPFWQLHLHQVHADSKIIKNKINKKIVFTSNEFNLQFVSKINCTFSKQKPSKKKQNQNIITTNKNPTDIKQTFWKKWIWKIPRFHFTLTQSVPLPRSLYLLWKWNPWSQF